MIAWFRLLPSGCCNTSTLVILLLEIVIRTWTRPHRTRAGETVFSVDAPVDARVDVPVDGADGHLDDGRADGGCTSRWSWRGGHFDGAVLARDSSMPTTIGSDGCGHIYQRFLTSADCADELAHALGR